MLIRKFKALSVMVVMMLLSTASFASGENYFHQDNWLKNREAIIKGSNDVGVDPLMVISFTSLESRLNANAKNPIPGQTAGGLNGFTKKTFNNMVKMHGQKYGITMANANRFDPYQSTVMIGELALYSETYLKQKLKRDITYSEIYTALFLGQAGAHRVIRAPNADLITNHVSSDAWINNKRMFMKNGRVMTVGEFKKSMYVKVHNHTIAYERQANVYIAQVKQQQRADEFRDFLNERFTVQLSKGHLLASVFNTQA